VPIIRSAIGGGCCTSSKNSSQAVAREFKPVLIVGDAIPNHISNTNKRRFWSVGSKLAISPMYSHAGRHAVAIILTLPGTSYSNGLWFFCVRLQWANASEDTLTFRL
jgi:hypothetical protein